MSRAFVLKGDTTHGGVVLDGIAHSSFDGRELAYLGPPVFCAACKTQGVIVSDGGERTMTVMGKVVALEPVQCRRTVMPFRFAMSSAPHAHCAVNAVLRMRFIGRSGQ